MKFVRYEETMKKLQEKRPYTNMLDFNSIAIFILGTTATNGRFDQIFKNYFESRIIPIHETWGSFYPHLYFVFGTNAFDSRFLHSRCSIINDNQADIKEITAHRRLVPKTLQVPSRNVSLLYECDPHTTEHQWHQTKTVENYNETFPGIDQYEDFQKNRQRGVRVLYTGNCTGEYFGLGPTCRCQESIRYFWNHTERFRDVEYFIFMDDDIYYRPMSLLTMLNKLHQDPQYNPHPVTIISSNVPRAKHLKSKITHQPLPKECTTLLEKSFFYAQPAIMNRAAIQKLMTTIDYNSMTNLYQYWGGSHDLILGLLLWILDIPLYSMNTVYFGAAIHKPVTIASTKTLDISSNSSSSVSVSYVKKHIEQMYRQYGSKTQFIYHRVMNMLSYGETKKMKSLKSVSNDSTNVKEKPSWSLKSAISSQYDIAYYLKDALLYNDEPLTMVDFQRILRSQIYSGTKGYETLRRLPNSTIGRTEYGHVATKKQEAYTDFLPEHCHTRTLD